ncbi:MAG: carboxypeptidase-like regulatory domain-containing protein [Phycisphaerae bacterium]
MPSEQPAGPRRIRKKLPAIVALVVGLVLVALLLLLRCDHPEPEARAPAFDYFRDKAEQLGRDGDRVLEFVRSDVRLLAYRGSVKGPLGALWESGGSPEEKLALARAILAHCPSERDITLDDVAPGRDKPTDSDQPMVYRIRMTFRRDTAPPEAEPVEYLLYDGPVENLIGYVHSIERLGSLTVCRLRGPEGREVRIEPGLASAEQLVIEVHGPHSQEPTVSVRELWDRANTLGPDRPLVGERHDLVVLPCRVGAYVVEKEALRLEEAGESGQKHADAYKLLLDYAAQSDEALARVEQEFDVRATFARPRVLILSQYPALAGRTADIERCPSAIDLRINRVDFTGDAENVYQATLVRSFIESGLEHHFLSDQVGPGCTGAYDAFCRLSDDIPNHPDERMTLALSALSALRRYGGMDGSLTFTARSPTGQTLDLSPAVTVRPLANGRLSVAGPPIHQDDAMRFALQGIGAEPSLSNGRLDTIVANDSEAAVLVEWALMVGGGPTQLPPDYVLDVSINAGSESLVAPGAVFEFQWQEGLDSVRQRMRILDRGDGVSFRYRVQTGIRPAVGDKTIPAKTLASAEVHNPWYVTGRHTQTDATSFCVARSVFAKLASGQEAPFALQDRTPAGATADTARPLTYQGRLTPAGRRTLTLNVNGRASEVPALVCRLDNRELVLLDDAAFPVGMADRIVSVSTPIRGRVVDAEGLGIAGATVEIIGRSARCQTWPDGRFRLPPAADEPYGKCVASVKHRGQALGEVDIDLTAPGLEEHVIQVDRKPTELLFVSPQRHLDLRNSSLPPQVLRNIQRALDAGHLVITPSHPVRTVVGERIGFYTFDNETGFVTAVSVSGLHGAGSEVEAAWGEALASLAEDLKDSEGKIGQGVGPVHVYRGALVGWWIFSAYRLEGSGVMAAVVRMLQEMDAWEAATNLMTGLEQYAGGDVRGKLAEQMNSAIANVDGSGSRAAFKLGYLMSTRFLATWPE